MWGAWSFGRNRCPCSHDSCPRCGVVRLQEDALAAAGVEAAPRQDPLGASSEYVGLRLPEGVEASLAHWSGDAAATARRAKSPATVDHLPANSCRRLHLGVDGLVDAHLGRSIPPLCGSAMKAAAMLACCREGVMPRFSKMSGIQQWADGVALFVNVGGRDYKCVHHPPRVAVQAFTRACLMVLPCVARHRNMFLHGGRHLTWFAQRTQHPHSPVIARMLEHAPRASSGGSDIDQTGTSCPVVLFCRLPQEPYVFCGRLRYVSHDPAVRPMRFVWELQDLDAALRADGESNMAAIVSGSR